MARPSSGNALTSPIKSLGFILILPGTAVSMMIRGTSNPIPYWLAAVINGLLYFGLAKVTVWLIARLKRNDETARG